MNNVLFIAGMHRSGTSLTARWLNKNGLHIGNQLLQPQFDNPEGFYEDTEILGIIEEDLRIKGLKTNGLDLKGHKRFSFEDITVQRIKIYLDKKKHMTTWGWKEPRTTLYLEEWKNLVPGMSVLAVYRPYDEVVDSLLRRTRHSFLKTKKYSLKRRLLHLAVFPLYLHIEKTRYLNSWIIYNQSIIRFKEKYPKDIVITSLASLLEKDVKLIDLLNRSFGIGLNNNTIHGIFNTQLLSQSAPKLDMPFSGSVKMAKRTLTRLNDLSDL